MGEETIIRGALKYADNPELRSILLSNGIDKKLTDKIMLEFNAVENASLEGQFKASFWGIAKKLLAAITVGIITAMLAAVTYYTNLLKGLFE